MPLSTLREGALVLILALTGVAAAADAGLPAAKGVTYGAEARLAPAAELTGVWTPDPAVFIANMQAQAGDQPMAPEMQAEMQQQIAKMRIAFGPEGKLRIVDPSGTAQDGSYSSTKTGEVEVASGGADKVRLAAIRDGARLILIGSEGASEVMVLNRTEETFESLPASCLSCGSCAPAAPVETEPAAQPAPAPAP